MLIGDMEKDRIPKETETIAARRAARISEKIRKARGGVIRGKGWWSNKVLEVATLVLIFLLNLYLVYPFFGTSAPITFFSGPIIPLVTKSIELLGLPLPYAIQIVNIIFFLIFPLSLYVFIRFITVRKMIALLAALIVSLPFYPFGEVRAYASLLGPDAAHIASLSVIPIAMYGLLSFLRKGGVGNLIVAAVASALVALVSPFGFMTYIIFSIVLTFSEVLLGRGRLKFLRFLTVLLFAGGFSSFWYNPSFFLWMITGPLGENIRYTVSKLFPTLFFSVPVLGAFGYLLFDRKPNLQPVFLASFLTIIFAIISLAGGGIFPSHPSRYTPELGISLSLLLSIIIVKLTDYLRLNKNPKLARYNKALLSSSFLLIVMVFLVAGLILGRHRLSVGSNQVLGFWTGVEKGEIWEEKEKFGGVHSLWGYMITGISIAGLGIVARKGRT